MKKIRLITNIISVLLIIGYIVFLAACWSNIPETVPTHFNALGKADAYGSKGSLIAEAIIMAALFLLRTHGNGPPLIRETPRLRTSRTRNAYGCCRRS